MAIGKLAKWIVIGIAVLLGLTYGVYAINYQGNYNVKVTVPVTGFDYTAGYHSVSASGTTTTSNPTSIGDFLSGLGWYTPSGPSSNPANPYVLYCELTSASGVSTQQRVLNSSAQQVPFEFTQTLSFTFKNVGAGDATVHIYIMDQTLTTRLYDHTWSVVVG